MVLLMVLKVGFALIICQALQSYSLQPVMFREINKKWEETHILCCFSPGLVFGPSEEAHPALTCLGLPFYTGAAKNPVFVC